MATARQEDRAIGAMLGLAAGDALGTTLEFGRRDSGPAVTDIVGGGPFHLQPGQWTDDSAMAVALAESLLACNGLNAHDLMDRFTDWWRNGAYSCTGNCFDIGNATRAALERYADDGNPQAGDASERAAGNGSLMRLAPVVLFAGADAGLAQDLARAQSLTTHAAPQCLDACAYFAERLRLAILGSPHVLAPVACPRLHPEVAAVAAGSWRGKRRDEIRSTGYVVHTLEAALWCVAETDSFAAAVLLAANLGDDADTVAAVTGQLAGALYGSSAIPAKWREVLAWSEDLETLSRKLWSARRPGLLATSPSL